MEEKILHIELKDSNIPQVLLEYLKNRKEDPISFGATNGYILSLINSSEQNLERRDMISKAFLHYIQSHFWAGILFALNNKEKIKTSYKTKEEIQQIEKERLGKQTQNYMG